MGRGFLILLIQLVQTKLFHTEVDDAGNDGEVYQDADKFSVGDSCAKDVESERAQVANIAQENANDWVDEVRHNRTDNIRNRLAKNETDRQTNDALLTNKFQKTGKFIFNGGMHANSVEQFYIKIHI